MAEVEDPKVKDLMEYYNLSERDCAKPISDIDIDEIAQSYCGKWRSLPAYLRLETILVHDVEYGGRNEEEKRRTFLRTWKDMQGSAATYKVLISALLKIRCRSDAEGVCQLIRSTKSAGIL